MSYFARMPNPEICSSQQNRENEKSANILIHVFVAIYGLFQQDASNIFYTIKTF